MNSYFSFVCVVMVTELMEWNTRQIYLVPLRGKGQLTGGELGRKHKIYTQMHTSSAFLLPFTCVQSRRDSDSECVLFSLWRIVYNTVRQGCVLAITTRWGRDVSWLYESRTEWRRSLQRVAKMLRQRWKKWDAGRARGKEAQWGFMGDLEGHARERTVGF